MLINETYNGFEVEFDYNPRIVSAIKNIPGRKFNGGKKVWFIPKDSKDALEAFAQRFGHSTHTDNRPEIVGDVAILPEPSEKVVFFCKDNIKLPPFHYQLQGVESGAHFQRFINGDEPGLGKTLQSIATVTYLNAFPCLVVCPS
ncbi:MAG: hypothetical protein EOP49_34105, partial [Sphingobacteriales bacterium]